MSEKADAAKALSRNLHAAIEQVRADVEKIEFWAEAVSGFSQAVPDYDPNKVKVWLPSEQATSLSINGNDARSRKQAETSAKSPDRGRDKVGR
jgi:hypothetical protein